MMRRLADVDHHARSRVHTHNHLLITSQYTYYHLVSITTTLKQLISFAVLQFTLFQGFLPGPHEGLEDGHDRADTTSARHTML